MDDPALTARALLNAAAVWFIFKAIEVIVFAVYDSYSAIAKWLRDRSNPDPDPYENTYDRRRGRLEYVLSGTGFLNIELCRQRRRSLLLISTFIPVVVFVLELLSITLGNESTTCETSTDPNVVSSPSLVLFGKGRRHLDVSDVPTVLEQEMFGRPLNTFRPCVSWSMTHAGVNFFSNLCANLLETFSHYQLSKLNSLSDKPIGVFLTNPGVGSSKDEIALALPVRVLLPTNDSVPDPVLLGHLYFTSEVVVNGKHLLYQNATIAQMSAENKEQLLQDVRSLSQIGTRTRSEEYDDLNYFGFVWGNATIFLDGVGTVASAILAQATREPIKTAAEMSFLNSLEFARRSFDISCEEDFRLPRTASIIIVVTGVLCRLILLFIPSSKSSVEFALEQSDDIKSSKDVIC